jgi:hypothetical protein
MKPSEIFETPESSGFNEAVTPHNEMPKDTVEEIQNLICSKLSYTGQESISSDDALAIATTAHNKGVEVGRERCIERIRQGHFAKVADDNWNDENTYGYKEAIKDIISTLDKEVSL